MLLFFYGIRKRLFVFRCDTSCPLINNVKNSFNLIIELTFTHL